MAIFADPENITGIVGFIRYTDSLTGGWLGAAMLIIIGMVSFLSTKGYSSDRAFGFSGFLVLVSALFLRFLNLINDYVFFIAIIFFVVSLIFLLKERSGEV